LLDDGDEKLREKRIERNLPVGGANGVLFISKLNGDLYTNEI
jgi:hypothetical protein